MRICRKKESINTDKYYTPLDECIRLVEILYENEFFTNKTDIIEPSAGSGNFVKALELLKSKYNLTFNIHAYDLEPEAQDGLITPIIQSDFFKVNLKQFNSETTGVVGNPPFGKSSSLLKKFIKYSTLNINNVAFIGNGESFNNLCIDKFYIPLTFIQKLNLNLHTKTFTYNNEVVSIRDCFFIWFSNTNTINSLYINMQEAFENFSKYAKIENKINTEASYITCMNFSKTGYLYNPNEYTFKLGISFIVNTDNITKEKFKEVWESSIISTSLNYRKLNIFRTIEQFLIKIN